MSHLEPTGSVDPAPEVVAATSSAAAAAAAAAATIITTHDRGKAVAVARFVGWMARATSHPKGSWDLPCGGAIAIGNMARVEEEAVWC
jgi:hypothetical protein